MEFITRVDVFLIFDGRYIKGKGYDPIFFSRRAVALVRSDFARSGG